MITPDVARILQTVTNEVDLSEGQFLRVTEVVTALAGALDARPSHAPGERVFIGYEEMVHPDLDAAEREELEHRLVRAHAAGFRWTFGQDSGGLVFVAA